MIRRLFFAAVCLAAAGSAAPTLTTIQDVLYKADGTRFSGTLTISWNSFQAVDSYTIVTQSTTVKVVEGNLRVQLVPTTSATPPAYYTVTYNSDGRVQFQETWAVPTSGQPLRVRDVRTNAPTLAADTGGNIAAGPVNESDVVGLIADLGARPIKGAAMSAGRVAFVNPLGAIDSVAGNASDCVHVDGSSGPCGSPPPSFVDGDAPAGIVDGSNPSFVLSGVPNPASSLAIYRNGVLQKSAQDYTATGNAVQFVAAAIPQPGDTLLASYRVGGTAGGTPQLFPSSQVLCGGTGASATSTTLSSIGSCTIPAGVLQPGDRVEIQFDFAHQGSASAFTFEVDWGATALVHRDGAASDSQIAGRASASILATGASFNSQSWGSVLTLGASIGQATDSVANGLVVNFQGKLSQPGDSLTLTNYTVVRFP
jgi:hypothetical protein